MKSQKFGSGRRKIRPCFRSRFLDRVAQRRPIMALIPMPRRWHFTQRNCVASVCRQRLWAGPNNAGCIGQRIDLFVRI